MFFADFHRAHPQMSSPLPAPIDFLAVARRSTGNITTSEIFFSNKKLARSVAARGNSLWAACMSIWYAPSSIWLVCCWLFFRLLHTHVCRQCLGADHYFNCLLGLMNYKHYTGVPFSARIFELTWYYTCSRPYELWIKYCAMKFRYTPWIKIHVRLLSVHEPAHVVIYTNNVSDINHVVSNLNLHHGVSSILLQI